MAMIKVIIPSTQDLHYHHLTSWCRNNFGTTQIESPHWTSEIGWEHQWEHQYNYCYIFYFEIEQQANWFRLRWL